MSDFNTSKIDGNTVGSGEWNQLADADNLVINSGQTPSTSNLDQLAIASARYSSGGQFFTDSGTANAYVLTPVSPFKSPVSSGAGEGYFNGMIIIFRAGNANSGASTVNVNSAGVKNLKKTDGSNLATGDILTTADVVFRYDGTNFIKLGAESNITITKYTSGSGTYTIPTNCKYIKVRIDGGGGGGGGSGTTAANNHGSGAGGGNSTFGTSLLIANGGNGGGGTGINAGGTGGTATINSPAIGTSFQGGTAPGGSITVASQYLAGNGGGNSAFGGASARGDVSASLNTGSGGGGGAGNPLSYVGSGGGASGFIEAIISSPSSTYSYSVGLAGSGGSAGTGGNPGGAGGSGYIEITEYY